MDKKYYWDVLIRGYTYPENVNKQVDPDLVMAMADALVKADEANAYADEFLKGLEATTLADTP